MDIAQLGKHLVMLRGPRRYARQRHRDYVFARAMRRFVSGISLSPAPEPDLLARLIYGWGNPEWSALEEFLGASLQAAAGGKGPILECGSGLSTLLVGLVAQHHGRDVWSLEHHPEWAERVRGALRSFGVRSVQLLQAPLRDYGGFSWYDVPDEAIPDDFSLVLCDGPPGKTPGGRYGFLPVMRSRLAEDCTIILDDAEREEEQSVARRWADMLGSGYETIGIDKPYIVIRAAGLSA